MPPPQAREEGNRSRVLHVLKAHPFIMHQSFMHALMYTHTHTCVFCTTQVRIIISGAGSHRYVDVVPIAAGKEQALQYVRQRYGIPQHLCVAAGDSGNDILMLDGDHPGIVVGNAQGELLHWLVSRAQDDKVLLADAFYADGVLEGLMRHGLY